MDLISVIVPIYKVEQYLDKCIQSIVDQTYKNLEIILVDDGSPDRCPEICDEWAKKDSRICVVHQKNSGVSVARNTGLDIAQGDYIGFVDSDDCIAPNMYEQLLAALKDTDIKASCCLISRFVNDEPIVMDKTVNDNIKPMNVFEAINGSFYERICNAVWCKLYRRSVFEDLRFPVGEVNEDYPLMLPIIIKSGGLVLVERAMYYYRKRDGGITSMGYATSRNAQFMHKNLLLIGNQLSEIGIECQKSFSFFVARNAYDMAIVMEKNIEKLDEESRKLLLRYRKMMWNNIFSFVFSKHSLAKDKLLYLLVLTKMIKPIYKIFNKPI